MIAFKILKEIEGRKKTIARERIYDTFRFYVFSKGELREKSLIFSIEGKDFFLKLYCENLVYNIFEDMDITKLLYKHNNISHLLYLEDFDIYLFRNEDLKHFNFGFTRKGKGEDPIFIGTDDYNEIDKFEINGFSVFDSYLYLFFKHGVRKYKISDFIDKLLNSSVINENESIPIVEIKRIVDISNMLFASESFVSDFLYNEDLSINFDFEKDKVYYASFSHFGEINDVFMFDMEKEEYSVFNLPLLDFNIRYSTELFLSNPEKFFKVYELLEGLNLNFGFSDFTIFKDVILAKTDKDFENYTDLLIYDISDFDFNKIELSWDKVVLKGVYFEKGKGLLKEYLAEILRSASYSSPNFLKFLFEKYSSLIREIFFQLKFSTGGIKNILKKIARMFFLSYKEGSVEINRLEKAVGFNLGEEWICGVCKTINPASEFICKNCETSVFNNCDNLNFNISAFEEKHFIYTLLYFYYLIEVKKLEPEDEEDSYLLLGRDYFWEVEYVDYELELIDKGIKGVEEILSLVNFPLILASAYEALKQWESCSQDNLKKNFFREYLKTLSLLVFKFKKKAGFTDLIRCIVKKAYNESEIIKEITKNIGEYDTYELKDILSLNIDNNKYLVSTINAITRLKASSFSSDIFYYLKNEIDGEIIDSCINYYETMKTKIPDVKLIFYMFSISINWGNKNRSPFELFIILGYIENFLVYDVLFEDISAKSFLKKVRQVFENFDVPDLFLLIQIKKFLNCKFPNFKLYDLAVLDDFKDIFCEEHGDFEDFFETEFEDIVKEEDKLKEIERLLKGFFSINVDFEYKFILAAIFSLSDLLKLHLQDSGISESFERVLLLLSTVLEKGYTQYDDFRKVIAAICLLELGVDKKWESITIELLEKNAWDDWLRVFYLGIKVLSYLKDEKYLSLLIKLYEKVRSEKSKKEILFRIFEISRFKAIELCERDGISWDFLL